MKKFKFNKGKVKAICIGTFLAGIVFSETVLATELNIEVTNEFEKWNNLSVQEKLENDMPRTYSVEIPEEILKEYYLENNVPNLISNLLGNSNQKLDTVSSAVTDSRYNIADKLNLRVEHQGDTSECWAFSMIKSLETNIALTSGATEIPDFSERHMDYATIRNFKDGVNQIGFNREIGTGGLPVTALAYLVNGTGAVLESEMPFENNANKINLSEINKEVDTVVTEYNSLPNIFKKYEKDEKGNTINVTYTDASGNIYGETQLKAARNIIKTHILENGAVPSITAANISKYYNNKDDIFNATNYNCNSEKETRDHAITIVGWDDNYAKENFVDGARPSTDGAYIVLNTYGTESFENGYMYISYEDYFIETELYSIGNSVKKDYDNIYQSDFYGGVFSIGTKNQSTGYFGNTFTRTKTNEEYVNSVGVTIFDYCEVEIFINIANDRKNKASLEKIGESKGILEPGYHRIDVTPTKIDDEEFSIVVKQKSSTGKFYFTIETPVENTAYEYVTSEGNSEYSLDGENWFNISTLNMNGLDMTKTDVCIKVFTTDELRDNNTEDTTPEETPGEDNKPEDTTPEETPGEDNKPEDTTPEETPEEDNKPEDTTPEETPGEDNKPENTTPEETPGEDNKPEDTTPEEIPEEDNKPEDTTPEEKVEFSSETYMIKDKNIYKINSNTTIKDFKNKIDTNSNLIILDGEKEVTDEKTIIKTGMKVKLSDETVYELIVRGDLNCDGKITLTDVSKMILHYNENKGFVLSGVQEKAADMNFDYKTTLTDVSQMLVLYNSI